MNIQLPEQNDIFALGFDRSLNRNDAQEVNGGGTVYDLQNSVAGQLIDIGSNIGGWSIGPNAFSAGNGSVSVGFSTAITSGDDVRIYAGNDTLNTAPFRVTESGVLYASAANITGTITASVGTIGGFTIGSDYIRDAADSMGLASTVTGGDDVRFYAGSTFANRATAPFRVTEAGAVTGSSVTITGGSVSGTPISSIPNDTNTDISILNFTHNLTFTVTDADTVAWTSGTLTFSNGRSFSLSSGNTGNMSALTYIYLDPGVSSTVLQTTTTGTTANGANKQLVGMAQNHTVTASFIPFGGGQPLIDGANIGALSVTATQIKAATITTNEIAASTITGTNINTMNIAGKNATFDTGTIGGFTMSATTLSATNFTVTSGAANTANLVVGTGATAGGLNSANASGDIAIWAGSTFANRATASFRVTAGGAVTATSITLSGYVVSSKGAFGGDGSDGALSISGSTLTTIDLANAAYKVLNYTSISITSTGGLTFSNPNTNGTIIVLKSQGAITGTSTRGAGFINASGKGGQNLNYGNSTFVVAPTNGASGVAGAGVQAGGAAGVRAGQSFVYPARNVACGAGGGDGAQGVAGGAGTGGGGGAGITSHGTAGSGTNSSSGNNNPSAGAGSAGGAALIIECAGAYNVSGTITVAGIAGVAATGGANDNNGGGGGGGGGSLLVLYNTLTADTGTYVSSGGAGGAAASSGGAGGGGGNGASFVGANTLFA